MCENMTPVSRHGHGRQEMKWKCEMRFNRIFVRFAVLGICLFSMTTVEAVNWAAAGRAARKGSSRLSSEVETYIRNWKPKPPKPRNPRKTYENVKKWLEGDVCGDCHGERVLPCDRCGACGRIICLDMFGNPMFDMFGNPMTMTCPSCCNGRILCVSCGGTGKAK